MYFTWLSKLILFSISFAVLLITSDPSQKKSSHNKAMATTASVQDTTEKEFKEAPDFTLETMEGNAFTLSDHKGNVVVLNFWATWCAPCRKEIPDFMEPHDEMKDDGVIFAGISLDEEGWEKVRPYANDMEINYPIVVDDGSVAKQYGPIRAVPTTFVVNKKGQMEYIASGMITKEKLKPILQKLANR